MFPTTSDLPNFTGNEVLEKHQKNFAAELEKTLEQIGAHKDDPAKIAEFRDLLEAQKLAWELYVLQVRVAKHMYDNR